MPLDEQVQVLSDIKSSLDIASQCLLNRIDDKPPSQKQKELMQIDRFLNLRDNFEKKIVITVDKTRKKPVRHGDLDVIEQVLKGL